MLRTFLPSVVRYSEEDGACVYVADNGSTDASVQMLREEFPMVRLILSEKNYGFAEGYNRALRQVEAEYVVLLNSDVEVTGHWLRPCWSIWTRILKWLVVSQKCEVGETRTGLSMRGRLADTLTAMAILFAGGVY